MGRQQAPGGEGAADGDAAELVPAMGIEGLEVSAAGSVTDADTLGVGGGGSRAVS